MQSGMLRPTDYIEIPWTKQMSAEERNAEDTEEGYGEGYVAIDLEAR